MIREIVFGVALLLARRGVADISVLRDADLLARSRDPDLDRHWRDGANLPGWSAFKKTWSASTRDAVARALNASAVAGSGASLHLPRIYIYPFPPALTNSSFIRAAANASWRFAPSSYFDLVFGKTAPGSERFDFDARGDAAWTPSAAMMGDIFDASSWETLANQQRRCEKPGPLCAFRASDQHSLPYTLHRSLAKTYPRLVDNPEDADLFFVPDHFDVTMMAPSNLAEYCAFSTRIWRAHLDTFPSFRASKTSSHFYSRGRAWHRSSTLMDYENSRRQSKAGAKTSIRFAAEYACAELLAAPALAGAQSIWLETQDDFARAGKRMHPVPYVGSLGYSSAPDFGRGWFRRDDGGARRTFRVIALFTVDNGGPNKDNVRRLLYDQCSASPECKTIDELHVAQDLHAHKGLRKKRIRTIAYEAYNRNADFCLQPPGHSAVRKGIVDSLLAGCIPVLTHHDGIPDGSFLPIDQPDAWPWNWPWQYASSVALSPNDIRERGLLALLDEVDEKQLELMRRVIGALAPNMAWPLGLDQDPPLPATPSPPWNALVLAMSHLWSVARSGPGDR